MIESPDRHTTDRLVRDTAQIGIASGDVLFVHASFKSLGPVDGGAQSVVSAFEQVLGPKGLLLMPSFNLIGDRDTRADSWDVRTTLSSVGWLTEFFRQMPGTFRSNHYSHSVAARGVGAERFVADHEKDDGLVSPWDRLPWGRTYGSSSPMIRAYDRGGKVLMLGVDYETSTYAHVVEVAYWNERLAKDPEAPFVWLDRPRLGKVWDRQGDLAHGQIGDSESRVFAIRDYVDVLLDVVRADPDSYDRVKLRTK
jgi:aminoglycoside 3-N-acetyltransferase